MKTVIDLRSEKGVAIIIALIAAIVVSLTAAVVINLTLRQFEFSAFQGDHGKAFYASEAGVQYAHARLRINDTNQLNKAGPDGNPQPYGPSKKFQDHVKDKKTGNAQQDLVVTSNPDDDRNRYDHYEPNLKMGRKHVRIYIFYQAGPPERFNVRGSSEYGTGD